MRSKKKQLVTLENLSTELTRSGDKFPFLKDVQLMRECRRSMEAGIHLPLTMEQKKRLYVLSSSLATVYFVAAPSVGMIKIGKTGNLPKRLATLKTFSPVPLELVMTIDYDEFLESRIHRYLAEYRSHGEWFSLCDPVRGFIRAYEKHGLEWLVEEVGDAPPHWMNHRRGLPEDLRRSSALRRGQLADDVTIKINP